MMNDQATQAALIDAQRQRIARLEQRLAWREQQAHHRLPPEEYRTAALAAFAAVEAAQRGNLVDLEALAPRTIAEMRAHLSTYVTALAAQADLEPMFIDAMRAAVLGADGDEGAA